MNWDNPVPVAAALVQYRQDIVLARNSQWPPGEFSLITGYLERGETPGEAAIREVKEELGLDAEVGGFIGCYSLREKNQLILAHWIVASGELQTNDEIAEIRLLSRADLSRWKFGRFALTSEIVSRWLQNFPSPAVPNQS